MSTKTVFAPKVEVSTTSADARESMHAVPLHRRFRFWLPMLAAFPAVLFVISLPTRAIDRDSLFIVVAFSNLLAAVVPLEALQLDSHSWHYAIAVTAALMFGCWYAVGRTLDYLRKRRGQQQVPGWVWVFVLFSVVQLLWLGIRFWDLIDWHLNATLRASGRDGWVQYHKYWLVDFNKLFVMCAPQALWILAWSVVLAQTGAWIRSARNSPNLAGTQPPRNQLSRAALSWAAAIAMAAWIVAVGYRPPASVEYFIPHNLTVNLATTVAVGILAFFCCRWLVPESSRWFRAQLRWSQMRRHLVFAGLAVVGFSLVTLLVWLDARLGRQIPRFVDRIGEEVLSEFPFGFGIPVIVWLAFRCSYREHWALFRRHAWFLLALWSTSVAGAFIYFFALRWRSPIADKFDAVWIWGLVITPLIYYRAWLFPDLRLPKPDFRGSLGRLRTRSWRFYALCATFAWLLFAIAVQNLTMFWQLLGFGFLLLLLGFLVPRTSRYRWILYGAAPAVLMLTLVGSYNVERDLLLCVAAFSITYSLWWLGQARGWIVPSWVSACALFLSIWGLCSAGDLLPNDFSFGGFEWQRLSAKSPDSQAPEPYIFHDPRYWGGRVGVALSGGGYRAALMDAGVLTELKAAGIPISNIAAVSGGSITAAHYALGGDMRELLYDIMFRQFNTTRDLFDLQNASRMLLSARIPGTHASFVPGFAFSRTDVQAGMMDRVLLHGRKFEDLPEHWRSGQAPKLMICVTDLNSGNAMGLTKDWRITRFLLHPPGEELFANANELHAGQGSGLQASTFEQLDSTKMLLSKAVAASSAFPLAFDPLPLRGRNDELFLIADGGVTDNTGITLLLEANRRAHLPHDGKGGPQGDEDWAIDEAISVDAGAMYQRHSADHRLTSLEAAGRAIDIIYARIGPEPVPSLPTSKPAMVLLSPYLYMDNSRNYDFRRIAKLFDPIPEAYAGAGSSRFESDAWDRSSKVPPGSFSPEQQQLFVLVARQLVNLDQEELQALLVGADDPIDRTVQLERAQAYPGGVDLEGLDPHYYEGLKRHIFGLSRSELRLLQQRAAGRPINAANWAEIDHKRLDRIANMRLLALRVAEDLSLCLSTFVRTPSLEDNIAESEARRLFRLGQYLALLNAPHIHRPLREPEVGLSSWNLTPAEKVDVVCSVEAFTEFGGLNPPQTSAAKRAELRANAQQAFDSCLARESSDDPALRSDLRTLHLSF